jgi:putative transcriptional regulator
VARAPSSRNPHEPAGELSGHLLVASPRLGDPNFEGAVVLLLDHGVAGALGIVLNQPTPVPVSEILELWQPQADRAPPGVVFRGGPVSPDVVIAVARGADRHVDERWRPVLGSVGTVDLSVPPDDQPATLTGVRLFAGYAGWSPDQLEAELAERAWFVLDALESDVLCSDAERLWHDVVRRQGGELSLLASYPKHPRLN